ncbi:MAG: crossover junction endodeoxyribonuclease RuvC [Chlorobiota bacterium]
MRKTLRIIGIDPGSIRCGYGVIGWQDGRLWVVEQGVIETKQAEGLSARLCLIFERLQSILHKTKPDEAAVESSFYARNAQALVKLAQARGVVLLSLGLARIPVVEYTPSEVKQAITGRGNAAKGQVHYMVYRLLSNEGTGQKVQQSRTYDVSDALAVALCHAFRRHRIDSQRPRTWREFIEQFPERVLTPLEAGAGRRL